jgi:CheY-like chemotaxis protein
MSRILLVDDSPHAQRMGERILSDEGYEVVTVSNADAALVRLEDVDPDIVLADTVMPGRTGYDICQYVKMSPRHQYVRVILTAGVTETLDEAHAKRVEADGTLRKPFEASVLLAAVRALADAAGKDRSAGLGGKPGAAAAVESAPVAPFIAVVDSEQVRAAVTVALDAAMGAMVEEITRRVLATLNRKKPDAQEALQLPAAPLAASAMAAAGPSAPPTAPAAPSVEPKPAMPPPAVPRLAPVRRVTPLRLRTGSILGLDISRFDPSPPPGGPETPVPED